MAIQKLPADYLERVYAGVLGKLIGVYVGRPFEGWSHERIVEELGHIHFYVHDQVDSPLVVTDDDISGTFVFVRALEEHGVKHSLSAEDIGKTWLNNTIEKKSIFWWGGRGISTEHTAFLNLKHGVKAPASGSVAINGRTIAEQIGAQIFIDGWAMVAPGNPSLAAKLAEAAGSVSHDGESVLAAKLWAAMEAEAFVSRDVDHLLDVGLQYIPKDCRIATLIADVRIWASIDKDWQKTRQRIEESYGYHLHPGICHIMPNHALMILALVYAGDDFHSALHIINTCGWDTDCNSGNIGCLVAIMHGLSAFDSGPDWRGPLADRALISSADGGYSANNAARIAYDLANLGRKLAGEEPLPQPKDGAQYHFTLPGSVQGFMLNENNLAPKFAKVEQTSDREGQTSLAVHLNGWSNRAVEVLTQVFTPPEIVKMKTYDLMAAPLISPGQKVTAVIRADSQNSKPVLANLMVKHYNATDTLSSFNGPETTIRPGDKKTLTWVVPDAFDSQPIQKLGIALNTANLHIVGTIHIDFIAYNGSPKVILRRPLAAQNNPFQPHASGKPCSFWKRAWIDNLSTFHTKFGSASFHLAQDEGEGILTTGTRDWINYGVTVPIFKINLGSAGIAVRVQGVNRYYALMFRAGGKKVVLVKARDEIRTELACATFEWELDFAYEVLVAAKQNVIIGYIGGQQILEANDDEYVGGGIGAIVRDASVSINHFSIGPI